MKQPVKATGDQVREFRKAARELGADESEAAFDAALGKIARHKPKEPEPKRKAKPTLAGPG
jgi:hypothetical protein